MPSGRQCAIKQLKPIANDPQIYQLVQERFRREAAILETLGEGNSQIPRLYAYFSEAGQFYLVQEWIEGTTLTQQVQQQGVMGKTAVLDLMISLLPVLTYVHSQRIIHRDLKPDNIILRQRDGQPVLIDFGAVKETMTTVMNPQGEGTSTISIGTPGFMAPEQAAGRPVYSSDLYSLGLTAVYLLSGKLPRKFATDPESGSILWQQDVTGIAPGLALVLERAIQIHPRDRYASAAEMLVALQTLVSSSQMSPPSNVPTLAVAPGAGSARPATQSTEATEVIQAPGATSPRQRRGLPVLGILIGVAIAVGALLAILPLLQPSRQPSNNTADNPTPVPSPSATASPAESPSASPSASIEPTPTSPVPRSPTSPQPPTSTTTQPSTGTESPSPTTDTGAGNPPQDDASKASGFPIGTTESTVKAALGTPTKTSPGLWRTRAVLYDLDRDRTLGLLFDRTSGRLRQTEAAFSQSVDPQVMQQTLANMLGGNVPDDARRALQQIQQRQTSQYQFTQGRLKGTIVRNYCDRIYIGIWESDLHGFVDARQC